VNDRIELLPPLPTYTAAGSTIRVTPIPLNVAVCHAAPDAFLTVTVPLDVPAAPGAKRTAIAHCAEGTRFFVVQVVLASWKPDPLAVTEPTVAGTMPVLTSCRVSAELPWVATRPKSSAAGVSTAVAVGSTACAIPAGLHCEAPLTAVSSSSSTGPCCRSPSAANAIGPSAPVNAIRVSAAITAARNGVAEEPALAGGLVPPATTVLTARTSASAAS
jgi:hypothetical protein